MQCHAVKKFCKTVYLDPINILNSSSSTIFIPRPPRGRSKLQEKPPAFKKDIQHFKTRDFFPFSSFFVGQFFFARLDSDPAGQNQCGSMRIRIHNSVTNTYQEMDRLSIKVNLGQDMSYLFF